MCCRRVGTALVFLIALATTCRADIYRWDNGQLIPGTEGITPGPGVQLANRQLRFARLRELDLTGAIFNSSSLECADLRGANLTNASLSDVTLAGANFAGAIVNGAVLLRTTATGFTEQQLYSTASYQAKNLQGIKLFFNDLSGWKFSGQDLSDAVFFSSLTNADFSGAIVAGTVIPGATDLGFTREQLYSTASYQAKDLRNIGLSGVPIYFGAESDLSGWDFSGQDLSGAAFFAANLTGANFVGANLINGAFGDVGQSNAFDAKLTNADLTAADARGAVRFDLGGAVARNTIRPDGTIAGLSLGAGDRIIIRDDDALADPLSLGREARQPIPIAIQSRAVFSEGGVLQLRFDADKWDSLISFEPGIPVALGGTLELTFTDGVNVATQVGHTLRIFEWSGVTPTGQFEIRSPYVWDRTNLYTTGEVTLTAVPEPISVITLLSGVLPTLAYGARLCRKLIRLPDEPKLAPFQYQSRSNNLSRRSK